MGKLLVKDMGRLAEFGFEKLSWKNNGHDMWARTISTLGDDYNETRMELIVNPVMQDNERLLIVNVTTVNNPDDGYKEYEADFPLDAVMELIENGVAEWKSDHKSYRVVV